jgi:uncharacterized SAM-binding protein YcdF (DUF218 family)
MKLLAAILIAVMFWGVGLLAFAGRVEQSTPADEPDPAQGIVVLTGKASVRIKAAAKLLEQDKGRKLLVSGVNKQVTREELLPVSKATRRLYDCCIQLGFEAADTKGNARETAAWAAHEHYNSLIVVTADYHMPRAMLELRGTMPKADLTPYPVKTDEIDAERWWHTGSGAKRMIIEYCKYLAVFARESFLSLGPRETSKTAEPVKEPA